MTPDSHMPVIEGDTLTTRDGTVLPLRRWEAKAPRAVIVALHGMSDYSNAFDMPGQVWAKAGITTIAYDQRGFGAGANPGIWAGAPAMRSDLADAVTASRARYPGVPVFVLGESMGGAVVMTALGESSLGAVDGAILVAPAVWSRSDMPFLYRAALFFGAHLLPDIIVSNSAAGRLVTITPSDNVPMLRALGRDPLFQKKTRIATLFGLVNLMDEARRAVPAVAPPILFLYGAHDQIIPAAPTQAVIAGLGAGATAHLYPQGYHMLLRDLDRAAVNQDVVEWILARGTTPARDRYPPGPHPETVMTDSKNDLRKGKPGEASTTNTQMPGHEDRAMPTTPSGEHAVNPGVGSKAGVGEGQVTKSN